MIMIYLNMREAQGFYPTHRQPTLQSTSVSNLALSLHVPLAALRHRPARDAFSAP